MPFAVFTAELRGIDLCTHARILSHRHRRRLRSALVSEPRLIDQSAETPSAGDPQPPVAERRPVRREHHGDVFSDPYEWLRDKQDADVIAYLEAENAYTEARTGHLVGADRGRLRRDQGPHPGDRPERADVHDPPRSDDRRHLGLLVLRAHPRGLGVPDLLPHPGRRRTGHPARRRGRDRRRADPAGRQRRGGRRGVLLPRRLHGLPVGQPAGVRDRRRRGRAVPAQDHGPDHRRAARRRDRRHRVRGRLGRRDAPVLHPGRRGLAAVRGAAAPARHRRRAPTPRC